MSIKMGLAPEALREVIHEYLISSHRIARALGQYVLSLQAGEFDRVLVDVVRQEPRLIWTIYDAFPFAVLYEMLVDGSLFPLRIEVQEPAFRDGDAKRIIEELARLPGPFAGSFRGGNEDSDGFIEWREPLAWRSPCGTIKRIGPGKAPLEVGYTSASTSLLHVLRRGGLARWPYGRPYIYLLLRAS